MGLARARDGNVADRLRRVEGQVRGIERMVQEGRDCPEILTQLSAVRGAVDEVERIMLHEHLRGCLMKLAKSAGPAEREHRIEEILTVVGMLPR
jgi:CsoR family transcriptional regulator, copper-sensing transcriptional repressor